MVAPAEVAAAAHSICEAKLIPKGISPPHEMIGHMDTARWYADAVNIAGLDVSGEDIVNAIIAVTGWDTESKWPGHPGPAAVIEYLSDDPNV